MQSLIRAEWRKTTGNRWVIGPLILVFPVMTAMIVLLATLIASGGRPEALARMGIPGPGQTAYWPDFFLYVWAVPSSSVGRWLLIAFAAVVFAGEYQAHTWKALLIRRPRWTLLAAKFITASLLILAAFVAASLILGVGMLLPISVAGGNYGPPVSGAVVGRFLSDYAAQMGLALLSALIATSYAALAALATRSVLGSVLIGIGAFFLEEALPALLGLIGTLLSQPAIVILYQLMPGYNLQNLLTWRLTGEGFTTPLLSLYTDANSPVLSVALLAIWLLVLIGLSLRVFARQDITG